MKIVMSITQQKKMLIGMSKKPLKHYFLYFISRPLLYSILGVLHAKHIVLCKIYILNKTRFCQLFFT